MDSHHILVMGIARNHFSNPGMAFDFHIRVKEGVQLNRKVIIDILSEICKGLREKIGVVRG